MFQDRYGLPLSTNSQAAADLFVDALDRIFSSHRLTLAFIRGQRTRPSKSKAE